MEFGIEKIHSEVSEICVLFQGKAHMAGMGKWYFTEHNCITASIQSFQRYDFPNVWNPLVPYLTSVLPMGKPCWATGQMTMTLHSYRPRQFHRTSNGENPSGSFRDMGYSKSWPVAHPPAHRGGTTIPLQSEGLRGKSRLSFSSTPPYTGVIKHIEAETKWTPFRRRHFQVHFLEWKCMNFA